MGEDAVGARNFGKARAVLVVELEHDTFFDNHGASLGAVIAELRHRKIKLEAESLSKLTISVSHVVNQALSTEFLSESRHNEWVVDGEGEDLVDARGLDCLCLCDEVGYMCSHAGWREGARVSHDANFFTLQVLGHIENLVRETILSIVAHNRGESAGDTAALGNRAKHSHHAGWLHELGACLLAEQNR